ncbi:Gamma-Tubulin Complex Component 6 [Manis pentadactyla]|nr:Gamma-Tubulin Complex Component 6 [Manis pentadactyla]
MWSGALLVKLSCRACWELVCVNVALQADPRATEGQTPALGQAFGMSQLLSKDILIFVLNSVNDQPLQQNLLVLDAHSFSSLLFLGGEQSL